MLKDAIKRKYGAKGTCGSSSCGANSPSGPGKETEMSEAYMYVCEALEAMDVPKKKHKDIYEMLMYAHDAWHREKDGAGADVEVKIGM